MFKELGIVVLNHDFKKYGLKEGSIGTVVHVYKDKKHAEVEFLDHAGKTIAVIFLDFSEISLANIKIKSEIEDVTKFFSPNFGLKDFTWDQMKTSSERSGFYAS